MIRGAIFDLDGTLLDSMPLWDDLGARYLRSIRITPREDLADAIRTMSLTRAAGYFQHEYGVERSTDEILRDLAALAADFYTCLAPLKPGAGAFVRRLRADGTALCIATAADRDLAAAALRRHRIDRCFSDILTCETVGCGKDDPKIYREALRRLGTPQNETVVFEDALQAAETAKRAGFPVVAVFDSREPDPARLRAIADFYLTDFTEESFWNFAATLWTPPDRAK